MPNLIFFYTFGMNSEHLSEKVSIFAPSKTKDALHTVLITTYGLKRNLYSDSIYATVTMDGLFAELT